MTCYLKTAFLKSRIYKNWWTSSYQKTSSPLIKFSKSIWIFFFSDAVCQEPIDPGPCFSALQYETQIEAAEGKSENCKKYLEELLNKCSWRNTTYTSAQCHDHCSKCFIEKKSCPKLSTEAFESVRVTVLLTYTRLSC